MAEKQKKSYEIAAQAAYDKKGMNITILDMKNTSIMADYFLICSAKNIRQTQSIADYVEEQLKSNEIEVRHVEGYRSGRWILLDTGDMIVHIFTEEDRSFYDLDNLWCDAGRIAFAGE